MQIVSISVKTDSVVCGLIPHMHGPLVSTDLRYRNSDLEVFTNIDGYIRF